jgi:hypothetical protein
MTTRTVAGLYVSYNVAVQSVRDLETAYIPDADTGLAVHRSGAHDRPVDSAHGVTAGPEAGASADAAIGGGVGTKAVASRLRGQPTPLCALHGHSDVRGERIYHDLASGGCILLEPARSGRGPRT